MTPTEALAALERVAAREVGRGSERLAARSTGSLRRAAESILAAPALDVAILTGFYIPAARPPAAETDGPPGAAQLAAAVGRLGGTARLVTDEPCAPVVAAALAAAGEPAPLDVAPLHGYDEWQRAVLPRYARLSHVIACERVGPAADGSPRNMRGVEIGDHTAPLHRLYRAAPGYRIGIGDGGNEIGMGALPADLVATVVDRGAEIHCVTGCDALLVGGTSNWAAAALVGALAVLGPAPEVLIDILAPAWSRTVLTAIVADAGAVDGVRRAATTSVDGLDWPAYAEPLAEIEGIVRAARLGGTRP